MNALKPSQVAAVLGCSRAHVYDLIHKKIKGKELKAFKLGGRHYRVDASEVERFKCDLSNTEADTTPTLTENAERYILPTAL